MRAPFRYRLLLRLLPDSFRRRHGAAMEEAFAEAWAEARRTGVAATWSLWTREAADMMRAAVRLRRAAVRDGHARGGSPEEGKPTSVRMKGGGRQAGWWGKTGDDLAFATRSLARNKTFTIFAVLTLALGVGASTAMFSAVDGVMLHPLPYPHADRMVDLMRSLYGGSMLLTPSTEQVKAWSELHDIFENVEPFSTNNGVELTGRGDPVLVTSVLMRPTLPAFLGATPVLGRSFTPAETADSTARVVLISSALWKSRFGGSRSVLGSALHLDGHPWTIVGVMPVGAGTPDGTVGKVDVWQPLPDAMPHPGLVVARLREGVTVQQAQTRLDEVAERHVQEGERASDWQEGKVFLAATMYRAALFDSLRVLMAAVTLLLLVACVNVANLLLSRAHTRRHEMAIRAALGAGGGRLVRHALVESLLLGGLGGGVGLALAWAALQGVAALRPEQLAALQGLHVDARVAAFAALVSLAASLLFGVIPAVGLARIQPLADLNGSGRGTSSGRTAARFRWGLVAGEVALSFALLVGSVMVLTSLQRLSSRDPGFDPHGLVDVGIMLPSWSYPDTAARRRTFDAMRRAMRGVAGVKDVALTMSVPRRMGGVFANELRVDGVVRDSGSVVLRGGDVGVDYLNVVGQPIVLGRSFTEADLGAPERPVILGESTARNLFPGESPLGRHFDLGDGSAAFTVVGVAGDILVSGLADSGNRLLMYTPMNHVYGDIDFAVRAVGNPDSALLEGLRRAVHGVEPNAVVERVERMDRVMADSLARQRFTTSLLTAFGVFALLLSGVGLYGVVAQVVGRRTREIGIRMSVGAVESDIRTMVLSAGAWATATGLVVGLGLTVVGLRLLSSQVFGLEGSNVVAYAAAAVAMTFTALLASWVPARRAASVDPVEAIRTE